MHALEVHIDRDPRRQSVFDGIARPVEMVIFLTYIRAIPSQFGLCECQAWTAKFFVWNRTRTTLYFVHTDGRGTTYSVFKSNSPPSFRKASGTRVGSRQDCS
ncbi:protein of unknown function [Pararobbsia alpina]